MNPAGPPVLVAVDGSPSAADALDLAADEASSCRLPLEIMHSYVQPSLYGPLAGAPYTAAYREPPAETVAVLDGAGFGKAIGFAATE